MPYSLIPHHSSIFLYETESSLKGTLYWAIPEGGRGVEDIHFRKNPGIFHFFYFTPGNSTQILHPWKFQKFLLDPLEIKAKNQDPWKFHIIFSSSPLEIPPHF